MQLARLAALFSLASAACFAETWSGRLVDAKCYAAEERNVNPTDTETSVDRDRNAEIRYCAPGSKTKSFTLILPDSRSFKLDSTGNEKAAELVRSTAKRSPLGVIIIGEQSGTRLQVDSIAAAPAR